jgi:hypothetical protein
VNARIRMLRVYPGVWPTVTKRSWDRHDTWLPGHLADHCATVHARLMSWLRRRRMSWTVSAAWTSPAAGTVRDLISSLRTAGHHYPGPRLPAQNRRPRPSAPAARCPHDGFHSAAVPERHRRPAPLTRRSGAATGEPPRPTDTATTQCGSCGPHHGTSPQPAPRARGHHRAPPQPDAPQRRPAPA